MRQLKSFPLLIPPLDIQLQFVSIVEKVSRMIERQQSALQGIEQAIRGLGSKLLLD
jgi:restriction endonuclease S subunit